MKNLSQIDLRQLRYFVAVAEECHFGRAAHRLHIAQPPLSQQIKRLESLLDVTLFDRSRRHVRLTAAGRYLLPRARQILSQTQNVLEDTWRVQAGELGRLTIGFVGSAAYDLLPRLLHAFRDRFPAVEVALRELPTGQQQQALLANEIDLGIVRPPLSGADELVLATVQRERLLAVLPADHHLAAAERLSIKQLRDDPFILFPHRLGVGLYEQTVDFCRQNGFEPLSGQSAVQMATIVGLVAGGFGVSLVPASVRLLQHPRAVFRPLIEASPLVELAVVRPVQSLNPAVDRFMSIVAEQIENLDSVE